MTTNLNPAAAAAMAAKAGTQPVVDGGQPHENTGPIQVTQEDVALAQQDIAQNTPAGTPSDTNVDPNALPSDADGGSEEQPNAERPAWLPEKFKTVEEMATAYKALEQKQGQPQQQTQQQSPEIQAASDVVTKAGLDWNVLNGEWQANNGSLADKSYEALAKQGVSKVLVDSFIKGQLAMATATVNTMRSAAFEAAGGEDAYKEAVQWAAASENMSDAEVASFNAIVNGTDTGAIKTAVAGLMAKYKAGGGNEPNNIGGGVGGRGGPGYANQEQMLRDMQDPRYSSDPAYRAKVEAKVMRTTAF